MLRTRCQIAVRPVSVGSLPIVSKTPDPRSRNRTDAEAHTSDNTRTCKSNGRRITQPRLVAAINTVANRKEDSDVIELAFQKSHSTIVRRAPWATSDPTLRLCSRPQSARRKRHTEPIPEIRQIIPRRFLLVVTPM